MKKHALAGVAWLLPSTALASDPTALYYFFALQGFSWVWPFILPLFYLKGVRSRLRLYLVLHGMASKNVIVEEGAMAEIPCMVSGDMINRGGDLLISGTVVGGLFEESGTTQVTSDAVIGTRNA